MEKVTLNKNGKPRKQGSGRKKGAQSLVSIRLSDLAKIFDEDDLIVCGRVFLEQAKLGYLPKISAPASEDLKQGIKITNF